MSEVILKRLKKFSSDQLVSRLNKKSFSSSEKEVAITILDSRKVSHNFVTEEIVTPKVLLPQPLLQRIEDAISSIIEEGDDLKIKQVGKLIEGVDDYSDLSGESIRNIIQLSEQPTTLKEEVKQVKTSKTYVSKIKFERPENIILTKEQEEVVSSTLSKKERVVKLASLGLTKQQQEKLAIAHWTYIYELYRELSL